MLIRKKAPVRISFGAAADTDTYIALVGEGHCINATINAYSYCEIHKLESSKIILQSLEMNTMLEYDSINQINFSWKSL